MALLWSCVQRIVLSPGAGLEATPGLFCCLRASGLPSLSDPAAAERWWTMSEQRRSPRRRVLKAGTISFGIAAGIDCVVKNISDTGALISVESSVGVPNNFTLVIRTDSLRREAVVKWRRARSIGIAFV